MNQGTMTETDRADEKYIKGRFIRILAVISAAVLLTITNELLMILAGAQSESALKDAGALIMKLRDNEQNYFVWHSATVRHINTGTGIKVRDLKEILDKHEFFAADICNIGAISLDSWKIRNEKTLYEIQMELQTCLNECCSPNSDHYDILRSMSDFISGLPGSDVIVGDELSAVLDNLDSVYKSSDALNDRILKILLTSSDIITQKIARRSLISDAVSIGIQVLLFGFLLIHMLSSIRFSINGRKRIPQASGIGSIENGSLKDCENEAAALEAALETAENAAKAKGEFLAKMTHELRTPMNGIVGMTDLILESQLNEEQREYAGIIRNSADALLIIINDILDYSKVEAGKLELEKLNFDLQTCLDDVADILAFKAQQKGLEYTTNIEENVSSLLVGDPGRLRQILINLTGNAIKFTEKGEIAISVKVIEEDEDSTVLRFGVRDTGPGLSPEKQKLLFQNYAQADSSIARNFGGTGLGLSISRQLSELMKGRIGVESRVGKGSEFWFTAKFDKQKAAASRIQPRITRSHEDVSILIVDGNANNRLVLARQLGMWGFRYVEAKNTAEAMHALKNESFDMVFTDMQMPDGTGEELGMEVRKDRSLDSVKLVMMTAIGKRGDAARLQEKGFAAFLSKPLKMSLLKESIEHILGSEPEEKGVKSQIITKYTLVEMKKRQYAILLVDDNRVNRIVAQKVLAKLGYSCDLAENGEAAMKLLKGKFYDLVFMDCQMPVMDGYTATREIRSWSGSAEDDLKKKSGIPIIALTANTMQEEADKCIESGMDRVLGKPLASKELAEVLSSIFNGH